MSKKRYNEYEELIFQLAEADDKIAQLRGEIAAFQSGDDALPLDWDFAEADVSLNDLLQKRRVASARYAKLKDEHEKHKKEETSRKLADLKSTHKQATIRLLQSVVALAAASDEASALADEAARLLGQNIGPLAAQHTGPPRGQFSLKNPDCVLWFWLREARENGILSGSEPWIPAEPRRLAYGAVRPK